MILHYMEPTLIKKKKTIAAKKVLNIINQMFKTRFGKNFC